MSGNLKVAICGIDARGHSRPCLEIVKALIRDGVEVDYLTASEDTQEFSSVGARIHPISSTLIKQKEPPKVVSNYGTRELSDSVKIRAVDNAISNLPEIIKYIDASKPDVLLSDKMCMAGRVAADHFSIPSANFHPTFCASHLMPGAHPTFDLPTNPDVVAEIDLQMEKMQSISKSSPQTIQELLGDHARCNVAFFSKEFHPFGGQLGEGYHFVGPVLPQARDERAMERQGVYISLGSIYGIKQDKFYTNCLEAFGDSGENIYISLANVKSVDYHFDHIPNNIKFIKEFDQSVQLELLSACRAFITHGGMNSIQEAISREAPMVIYPIGLNQQVMGNHVEAIHCGRKLLAGDSAPERLADAVKYVAGSDDIRRGLARHRDYAERGGGAGRAVSVIRSLAS